MNVTTLVKRLAEVFGDRVIVRSQYHVQITSSKGPHDIWISKIGYIKLKMAGDRETHEQVSLSFIVNHIKAEVKTSVEKMQEMLDVAKFMNQCEKTAQTIGSAIFTDSGFKDGKAKIAAIVVDGTNIDAKSRLIEVNCNSDAERQAIVLGLTMHATLTVYNDSLSVVNGIQNERVKWLPRTSNKAADSIGNLRQ
jgi:hypothetical protein